MTKQRLMLSAAMAALLAAPVVARADTTITEDRKSAIETSSGGNIIIQAGGQIEIKAASPAVTINSNNSLLNGGGISNTDTGSATGILIDTTGGDLVNSSGISNLGAISLSGDGGSKAGIAIIGGHTFYGPITLTEVLANVGSGTSVAQASSLYVQGDASDGIYLAQDTTVDGAMTLGGTLQLVPNKNSSGTGSSLIELDGNLNGNLVLDDTTVGTVVGNQSRGIAILGPIKACVDNSGAGYSCANPTSNAGAFVNDGTLTVVGTATPNYKGGNPEGGSVVVIANSVQGGFLNNGPATAIANTAVAALNGSGAIVNGVALPVLQIDPSLSVTATNTTPRGPVILGPIPSSIDSVDPGYSFINRGTISAAPTDFDVSTVAMVIQGSSATNYTCLGDYAGSVAAGHCVTTDSNGNTVGGLLNTGTIQARATTSVDSDSSTSATAAVIGGYTTIPRFVISGEPTSGSTYTPGILTASVSGPGGGTATALSIDKFANVPEIDVLSHGTISASVTTSTLSPTAQIASTSTPFVLTSAGIVDASGSVKTINNAGTISALNSQLTPASNAVVSNTNHAIDLLAGTSGGTTINNSGTIQGDVYFNSGGGSNTLNVGNTGKGVGDTSGDANAAVAAAQGSAVTNTPYDYATVSGRITSTQSGFAPTSDADVISFGSGTGNVLHVGGYGYVNGVILAAPGGLDVQLDNNGQLFIANTEATGSLNAHNFDVNGGVLGLTISQNTSVNTPVVSVSNEATISGNAKLGLQFGTFIHAADPNNPTAQMITLISTPAGQLHIDDSTIAADNSSLSQSIPFLFQASSQPLSVGHTATNDTLELTLTPRVPGAGTADNPGLGLSGDALKLFPYTIRALDNDPTLGAAIASNLTVYNSNAGSASGINVPASQQKAQQVFSQFAPDVSGGARAVAIAITDQATGPVAARQRLLRSYGDQEGEMTLWGTEFSGMIHNKGRFDGEGELTSYKDHGFGFSLGMDGGSARGGWYGGALTFYSSDVIETLPRSSKTNMQWYMLTGYTDWHGRHIFLDTKADIGYGSFRGMRTLSIGDEARTAVGKRAGLLASVGATTGLFYKWGDTQLIPHVSLDGLTMREEGYTEDGGGDGFNLQVAPYYANSLRGFLGADVKQDFTVWGANLTPEARLGYRYDFVGSPVKLKAGFASTGGLDAPGNSFTFVGPDPDTGNVVLGASLGAGTDTWQLGFNYDWVRGNNNSTTQMGTITLLGRI